MPSWSQRCLVNLADLGRALSEVHTRVQNARATTGTGVDVDNAYIRWVNEAAEYLVRIVPTARRGPDLHTAC